MNQDKWKALPEDVQAVIRKINREWVVKTGQAWDESDQEGWDYLAERKVQVIDLDPEEQKRWSEAVRPLLDDYVAKAKAKNLPGEQILKTAQDALEKANKIER